jgi:hypothetical protein
MKDERGCLTVIDKALPFDVKRIFFIHDVTADRGGHRHKKTKMAMVCLSGNVKVYVQSPSSEKTYSLDSPAQCLILDPEDWHSMHDFSESASLVVAASESYDKTDYILEKYR